jgi:hypothetical protein
MQVISGWMRREVVHNWLAQQQGIDALVKHWRKCAEHGGDYTEDNVVILNPFFFFFLTPT